MKGTATSPADDRDIDGSANVPRNATRQWLVRLAVLVAIALVVYVKRQLDIAGTSALLLDYVVIVGGAVVLMWTWRQTTPVG